MAIFGHLGLVLGGFVVPLVLHLSSDERDRFTRSHTAEALNYHLTLLCLFIPLIGIDFALTIAIESPAGILAGYALILAGWVVSLIWSIKAAIHAGRGQQWRYPLRIPFVHGDF